MKKKLSIPPGFIERDGVNSQNIKRDGFPEQGVMFTTSQSPASSDFDPALLIGAYIENGNSDHADPNKLFRILGGYYFQLNQDGKAQTTQVFGIAAEPGKGFEIEENGVRVVGDHWTTDHGSIKFLNEAETRPNGEPPIPGWTFIVAPRQGKVWPISGEPLAVWIDCPEMEGLELEFARPTREKQEVLARIIGDVSPNMECDWDWGDGSPVESKTGTEHSHMYNRDEENPLEYEIKVTIKGPAVCEQTLKQPLTISAPGCPTILKLNLEWGESTETEQTVELTVETDGLMPEQFVWDWGDGTAQTTTTEGKASHAYPRPYGNYQRYWVRLKTSGPGKCQASHQLKVDIPAIPCPDIQGLTVQIVETKAEYVTVKATAQWEGPLPQRFHWDWGDGNSSDSRGGETTHRFERADTAQQFQIKVSSTGPGPCKSEQSASVQIPALEKEPVDDPPPVKESIWCRIFAYLVAFLSALTLGRILVGMAGILVPMQNPTLVWVGLIVFAVLLAITIYFWYRKCDPTRCDWLAVGWVSLSAALIVCFRGLDCLGNAWIAPAAVAFILAGLMAYLWFRDCGAKSPARVFWIYLLLALLAGAFHALATMPVVFSCP